MTTVLQCGAQMLSLDGPCVMGVVNVTPDSFSDGGLYADPGAAVAHAHRLVAEGAVIVDVGGESTRPGAAAVSVEDELARVLPVVERLARELPVPVSIDTSKPEVIRAAADAGAGMINDVYALRRPGALEAAARSALPVCLMHMQGEPRTMQQSPRYDDIVSDVEAFLRERMAACEAAGIARERILVDPGFGFGKTDEHNLALLRALPRIAAIGPPVLVGLSRKSMIGRLTGRGVDQRLAGSLALALAAVAGGARLVRAHDVVETVDAWRLWDRVHGPVAADGE